MLGEVDSGRVANILTSNGRGKLSLYEDGFYHSRTQGT